MARSKEIQVRRAEVGDAAEVARMLDDFNREFGDPTPGVAVLAQRVSRMLEAGEMTVLLGGRPARGIAVLRLRSSFWTGAPDAYLEELYVESDRRGHGIGRALLEATMATAREGGARHIELATSEDDRAAIALYESCGFSGRERPPDGPRMLFYEREL